MVTTPFLVSDQVGFVGIGALARQGEVAARKRGFAAVGDLGAAFGESTAGSVAG